MLKNILIILIAVLVFFIQSCYTIIKQSDLGNNHYKTNAQFPLKSGLDSELEGVWINKILWMDYGYQIRRLEIKNDGSVIYIPDSEKSNSKIYYGSYRVISDTLIIKFDEKNNFEWMNYKLDDTNLAISNLKDREGTENNLINDCYNCFRNWGKVQ